MEQQALALQQQIIYSPQNYYVHSGVQPMIALIKQHLAAARFSLTYIIGASRSGKTHLAVYLADIAVRQGLNVFTWNGLEIDQNIKTLAKICQRSLVLIDDADLYLSSLKHGSSGPLVAFIEHCRVIQAPIIFLSNATIDSFNIDQHLISRLKMGSGVQIDHPNWDEFEKLFCILAEQRGLKLPERQLAFLNKRIGASIIDIEQYLEKLYELKSKEINSGSYDILKSAIS